MQLQSLPQSIVMNHPSRHNKWCYNAIIMLEGPTTDLYFSDHCICVGSYLIVVNQRRIITWVTVPVGILHQRSMRARQ